MRARIASRASGFTLIELLVVLAILAALSLVALRSVDGLQQRAQFETTTNRLEAIETAILGTRDGLPGSVREGGYLADIGAMPGAATGDATTKLADLLVMPAGMSANHLVQAPGDLDVRLAVGWRGPYLRTTTGAAVASKILDGFGSAISLLHDDATDRWSIVSTGADEVLGAGDGYDADVAITLPAAIEKGVVSGSATVATPPIVGAGVGQLPSGHQWSVVVYAYTPDASTGTLTAIAEDGPRALTEAVTPSATTGPFSFSFSFTGPNSIAVGPRALRAYVYDATAAPADPRVGALKRSPVAYVDILRGAQTLTLEID